MGIVSDKAAKFFIDHRQRRISSNTEITTDPKYVRMVLFGNTIASWNTEKHVFYTTLAGWPTTTTVSRLDALLLEMWRRKLFVEMPLRYGYKRKTEEGTYGGVTLFDLHSRQYHELRRTASLTYQELVALCV